MPIDFTALLPKEILNYLLSFASFHETRIVCRRWRDHSRKYRRLTLCASREYLASGVHPEFLAFAEHIRPDKVKARMVDLKLVLVRSRTSVDFLRDLFAFADHLVLDDYGFPSNEEDGSSNENGLHGEINYNARVFHSLFGPASSLCFHTLDLNTNIGIVTTVGNVPGPSCLRIEHTYTVRSAPGFPPFCMPSVHTLVVRHFNSRFYSALDASTNYLFIVKPSYPNATLLRFENVQFETNPAERAVLQQKHLIAVKHLAEKMPALRFEFVRTALDVGTGITEAALREALGDRVGFV